MRTQDDYPQSFLPSNIATAADREVERILRRDRARRRANAASR